VIHANIAINDITLHITLENYSGLSKSNFKDHYGDVVITQCLGKIAEINDIALISNNYIILATFLPQKVSVYLQPLLRMRPESYRIR